MLNENQGDIPLAPEEPTDNDKFPRYPVVNRVDSMQEELNFFFYSSELISEMVRWIIRQAPIIPDLFEIIKAMKNDMSKYPLEVAFVDKYKDGIMYKIAKKDLFKYVDDMVKRVPELRILNLRQVERDKGLTADDVDNDEIRFRTCPIQGSDGSYSIENDFVDLEALSRNVANSILK